MQFDLGRVVVKKRSRLPHWHAEHGIYFVTWHLVDAIPPAAREAINRECDAYAAMLRARHGRIAAAEVELVRRLKTRLVNQTLDQHLGSCVLRDDTARIVADAITYFDDVRYQLYAWCVMPNHAHVVFSCCREYSLDGILHSWKSYTSNRVNERLGRTGSLWQGDYYDSNMRNDRQLQRTIAYVAGNPAKAELFGWPFVRVYPERIAAVIA